MAAGAERETGDFDVGFAEGNPIGRLGALGEQREGSSCGDGAGGEAGSQEVATEYGEPFDPLRGEKVLVLLEE